MDVADYKRVKFVHEINSPELVKTNHEYINALIKKGECRTLEDVIYLLDGLNGLERTTPSNADEVLYLVREEF